MTARHDLVAVGASWGGLEVLREILRDLPADLDAAVVIAQHRSPESHPTAFRDLLGAATRLNVREASDKDVLEHGHGVHRCARLSPARRSRLDLALDGRARAATRAPRSTCSSSPPQSRYRERCVGVVLTGANDDGANGLARVVELGGMAIVQDPSTAQRDEMPRAAFAAVPMARVRRVEEIAPSLVELCGVARCRRS